MSELRDEARAPLLLGLASFVGAARGGPRYGAEAPGGSAPPFQRQTLPRPAIVPELCLN
jgi:hypothetical protein